MPNKYLIQLAVVALLMGGIPLAQAAELSTLFTTQEERQIINSNRYKNEDDNLVRPVDTENEVEVPIQLLIKEEVTKEFTISGITVSNDGPHTVWINALAYEDGEMLEDEIKVKVLVGDDVRVRITAPDGKHYYATSGETLAITYLAPIED